MKTTVSNIIATVTVILIGIMLASCASEELFFSSDTVDNVIYNLDRQAKEATAIGYKVVSGTINPDVTIPGTITSINITYHITAIAPQALAHGSWESVTIGENVRVIGESAFADCSLITTIRLRGLIAPAVSEDSFDPEVYDNATLVIEKSLDIEGTPWTQFKNITRI